MASPRRGSRRSRSRDRRRSTSRDRHIKRARRSPSRERKRSRSREFKDSKRHRSEKHISKSSKLSNGSAPTTFYSHQDKNDIKNTMPPLPTDDMASAQLLIEQEEMKKLMGFANFDTTKNKHVEGNIENSECLNKVKKRKYRQYMNRKGGFNRPLDYVV